MEFKWYALLVASKKETYVKNKIENSTNSLLQYYLSEVLLPTEKKIYEVRRKKVVKYVPIYPNYLFILANLSQGLQSIISDLNFVVKILGIGDKPSPIRDQEINLVKAMAGGEKVQSIFNYKVGDMVEVVGGHCKGLSGRIIEIVSLNVLKIEIQIFNRAIYTTAKVEDLNLA